MDALVVVGGVVLAGTIVVVLEVLGRRGRGPSGPGDEPAAAPQSVRSGLRATRERFLGRLEGALRAPTAGVLDRLEEVLVEADVGTATARALIARVGRRLGASTDPGAIREALRQEMLDLLAVAPSPDAGDVVPYVVLVVGVNGVGKTTSVGKLAARYRAAGKRVLVIAADTYRAAAATQLERWAEQAGVEIVRNEGAGSPAAVVFDGMRAACARGTEVVLIDTAGRLHTRKPLVDELRKVHRVIGESVAGAPHRTLLVVDATTGQNALSQARTFADAVALSGVILTKLDGTARGGITLALAHELSLPITDVGVGEGLFDLRPFAPEEFVAALLDPVGGRGRGSELQDCG